MADDDPNAAGITRRHIIEQCEASLRRLQTAWIDLYQLHRPEPDTAIDETLRALDDLVRDGKVRYLGTSMFPSWQIVESIWAAKELRLNRFVSEQQPGFYRQCAGQHHTGFLTAGQGVDRAVGELVDITRVKGLRDDFPILL